VTVLVWPVNPPPYIAGGQLTPEEAAALAAQYGAGSSRTVTPGTTGPGILSNLVGRQYIDPTHRLIGTLQVRDYGRGAARAPGRYYGLLDDAGNFHYVTRGQRLYDPQTATIFDVGGYRTYRDQTGNEVMYPAAQRDFFTQANQLTDKQNAGLLASLGLTAGEGGGGVSANTSAEIASRESIAAADRAQALELEKLRNQQALELERMQEESSMKRQRLSEAGSLAQTAATVQQRTRDLIAQLTGVDPVRAAVGMQGGLLGPGQTPAESFMSANRAFVNQPIPVPSEQSDIPSLEQTIGQLQGMQQGPQAPALGLATGGTIDMQQGPDGAYQMAQPPMMGMAGQQPPMPEQPASPDQGIQPGTTKQAILVGEKGSKIAPGTEVMVVDSANPGRTEIIPLVSTAQGGLTYDPGTIAKALSSVYGSLGFGVGNVPRYSGGYYSGGPNAQGWSPLGYAAHLGYRPRLIRTGSFGESGLDPSNPGLFGHTFWIDPSGGRHWIAGGENPDTLRTLGFRPEDVAMVAPSDVRQFAAGPQYSWATPPQIEAPVRSYPTPATPLVSPVGGFALPDPRMLAGIWRFLDPYTQEVLSSTYGVSGLGLGSPDATRAAIEQEVQAFTPHGTASGQTARFG